MASKSKKMFQTPNFFIEFQKLINIMTEVFTLLNEIYKTKNEIIKKTSFFPFFRFVCFCFLFSLHSLHCFSFHCHSLNTKAGGKQQKLFRTDPSKIPLHQVSISSTIYVQIFVQMSFRQLFLCTCN